MTPPSSPRAGRSTVSAAGEPICRRGDQKRLTCITHDSLFPSLSVICMEMQTQALESRRAAEPRPSVTDLIRSNLASLERAAAHNGLTEEGRGRLAAYREMARAASPAGPPPMSEQEASWYSDLEEPGEAEGGVRPDGEREVVAAWMIEHGFATGHGDTLAGLLSELAWQIDELRGAVPQSEREGLDELTVARIIHEAEHGHRPPLLSCMTKHRRKAKRVMAALASPAHPDEE